MTLTDRYVAATLRRLPERQRPDIEKELRASIADAVDDRLESGGDPADAEVAVLTALGDPARLAAGYADRPLQLIGPALYLDYTRLLRTLLATVVPAVAGAVGIVGVLRDDAALTVAGNALGAALTAAVHVALWTTLAFATYERIPALRVLPGRRWTPDALPEPPSRRSRYAELVTETVATVLVTAYVLLSPVLSTERDAAGDPVGVLSPWLWDTGVVYAFIGLVIVLLGFSFAKYYLRWSLPLAIASGLAHVLSSVTLIWLTANHHIVNPAFAEAAGWPAGTQRWIEVGLIAVAAGTVLHVIREATIGSRGGYQR